MHSKISPCFIEELLYIQCTVYTLFAFLVTLVIPIVEQNQFRLETCTSLLSLAMEYPENKHRNKEVIWLYGIEHAWHIILNIHLTGRHTHDISNIWPCCFQDLSVLWTPSVRTSWWRRWGSSKPSMEISLRHASFFWIIQRILARNFTSDRLTMCQ